MKLPRKVKVLGGELLVLKTPGLDGGDSLGMYSAEDATVYIGDKIDPSIERLTFVHELVHDAMFRTGLDNGLEKDARESICDGLGLYFSDFIKRNPEAVAYLQGG